MSKVRVIKQLFFSVLIIILVGGCADYNQYRSIVNVEILPEEGEYKGKAAQIDRGSILTTHKKDGKLPSICAEPFPESASALEILRKYNLAAKGQTTEKKDSLELPTSIPFGVHPAVKFYRDGVFALCQRAINGWVNTEPKKPEACAGSTNQEIAIQSQLCNQKPYLSEFEYQLNELRKTVVEIFEAEANRAQAEADKAEADAKMERATQKD